VNHLKRHYLQAMATTFKKNISFYAWLHYFITKIL